MCRAPGKIVPEPSITVQFFALQQGQDPPGSVKSSLIVSGPKPILEVDLCRNAGSQLFSTVHSKLLCIRSEPLDRDFSKILPLGVAVLVKKGPQIVYKGTMVVAG